MQAAPAHPDRRPLGEGEAPGRGGRGGEAAGYLRGERFGVEARLGPEIAVNAEGTEITAELTSTARRVPLRVTGLGLTVDVVRFRVIQF
ncbi:hypothetical protein [Streptosporangium sp. V21-05]|uniref:hypothetical protein n=1 Tax=Streptosporangium sp. V21-05 TaxID=3446115 RepID=UPI003F5319EC